MLCDDCKNKEACRFYIASFENVNHPLNDPYYRDSFYCDEHCTVEKPLTNGERIRAMSDEELAWELLEWRFDAYGKAKGDEAVLPSSQREIKDWLKQPVEDK